MIAKLAILFLRVIYVNSGVHRLSIFIKKSVTVLDQAFAEAKGVSGQSPDFRVFFPGTLGKS